MKKDCQGEEACQIDVSREFFGNEECPSTDDAKMSLWLDYSCDGRGTDRTKSNWPKCDGSDVTTKTTLSPPKPPTTGKCNGNKKRGKKKQLKIPGCGGGVAPDCNGGCLNIHKVLKDYNPLELSEQTLIFVVLKAVITTTRGGKD